MIRFALWDRDIHKGCAQMASCAAGETAGGTKAAVLHGINDLRVEQWPISAQLAAGHVSESGTLFMHASRHSQAGSALPGQLPAVLILPHAVSTN